MTPFLGLRTASLRLDNPIVGVDDRIVGVGGPHLWRSFNFSTKKGENRFSPLGVILSF
jgi:hypothetical protein